MMNMFIFLNMAGCTGVYIPMSKLIKFYILKHMQFIYVNYISIKLFKRLMNKYE